MKKQETAHTEADFLDHLANVLEPMRASPIAFEVMAITFLAANHGDRVRAIFQCLENMLGLQAPRTRHGDLFDGKGPSKIGRGGTAPEARAGRNCRARAVLANERYRNGIAASAIHGLGTTWARRRVNASVAGRSSFGSDFTHA